MKEIPNRTFGEDTIKLALALQHKNTRHDAVDEMVEIFAKWSKTHDFESAQPMLNEMTGAVMNLKQRIPQY